MSQPIRQGDIVRYQKKAWEVVTIGTHTAMLKRQAHGRKVTALANLGELRLVGRQEALPMGEGAP